MPSRTVHIEQYAALLDERGIFDKHTNATRARVAIMCGQPPPKLPEPQRQARLAAISASALASMPHDTLTSAWNPSPAPETWRQRSESRAPPVGRVKTLPRVRVGHPTRGGTPTPSSHLYMNALEEKIRHRSSTPAVASAEVSLPPPVPSSDPHKILSTSCNSAEPAAATSPAPVENGPNGPSSISGWVQRRMEIHGLDDPFTIAEERVLQRQRDEWGRAASSVDRYTRPFGGSVTGDRSKPAERRDGLRLGVEALYQTATLSSSTPTQTIRPPQAREHPGVDSLSHRTDLERAHDVEASRFQLLSEHQRGFEMASKGLVGGDLVACASAVKGTSPQAHARSRLLSSLRVRGPTDAESSDDEQTDRDFLALRRLQREQLRDTSTSRLSEALDLIEAGTVSICDFVTKGPRGASISAIKTTSDIARVRAILLRSLLSLRKDIPVAVASSKDEDTSFVVGCQSQQPMPTAVAHRLLRTWTKGVEVYIASALALDSVGGFFSVLNRDHLTALAHRCAERAQEVDIQTQALIATWRRQRENDGPLGLLTSDSLHSTTAVEPLRRPAAPTIVDDLSRMEDAAGVAGVALIKKFTPQLSSTIDASGTTSPQDHFKRAVMQFAGLSEQPNSSPQMLLSKDQERAARELTIEASDFLSVVETFLTLIAEDAASFVRQEIILHRERLGVKRLQLLAVDRLKDQTSSDPGQAALAAAKRQILLAKYEPQQVPPERLQQLRRLVDDTSRWWGDGRAPAQMTNPPAAQGGGQKHTSSRARVLQELTSALQQLGIPFQVRLALHEKYRQASTSVVESALAAYRESLGLILKREDLVSKIEAAIREDFGTTALVGVDRARTRVGTKHELLTSLCAAGELCEAAAEKLAKTTGGDVLYFQGFEYSGKIKADFASISQALRTM